MYPKTRDLEIIYNLVWRSKPHQSDDRANIVGMYDIPSTTLNWEMFKSYLLKNSGSNATDIKVSYVDSNDKEFPINNQQDFLLALYSFRRRARIGEIITLKVDKLESRKTATQTIQSSDAEIQTHDYKDEATQPTVQQDNESPPKWFTKHMKKFEKKMFEEMKQQFGLMGTKMQNTCQHSHTPRSKTAKPESYKRSRKFEFTKVNLDKDMCKKYAFKLDESDHRPSQKTKAKKLAAMKVSSDSDVGRESKAKSASPQKPINFFFTDPTPPSNNVLLNSSSDKTAGPLFTNSVYLQKWEVTNCGMSAWDERTELRYAWGSEKLRPTFTILKCPELQPGEKGEISVWFQIPSAPGSYECYWHFYDCGRRFGRWIGCQLNVVDYHYKPRSPYATQPLDVAPSCIPTVDTLITAAKLDPIDLSASSVSDSGKSPPPLVRKASDVSQSLNELLLVQTSTNNLDYTSNCEPSSDSDNISILSGAQTPHSGSSDYVVVPSPDTTAVGADVNVASSSQAVVVASNKVAEAAAGEISVEEPLVEAAESGVRGGVEDASANDAVSVASEAKSELAEGADDVEQELHEIKMADVAVEQSEYAYIYYNGEKYPFHKDFLRSEYFNAAEKCASSEHSSGSVSLSSKSSNEGVETAAHARSRETSTSSQESRRLFVFPRHSPGFEVVYPADDAAANPNTASSCSYEGEEYFSIKDGFQFPPASASNFYHDERRSSASRSKEYAPSSRQQEALKALAERTPAQQPIATAVDVSQLVTPHTPATTSTTYTSPSALETLTTTSTSTAAPRFNGRVYRPSPVHPNRRENIVTQAAMLAGTGMGAMRNVVNMVMNTGGGKWVNGHWVAEGENTKRENGLKILAEMGFVNRDLNATLLARYNDDVHRVISELVQ